jgi:hypothetical protein
MAEGQRTCIFRTIKPFCQRENKPETAETNQLTGFAEAAIAILSSVKDNTIHSKTSDTR